MKKLKWIVLGGIFLSFVTEKFALPNEGSEHEQSSVIVESKMSLNGKAAFLRWNCETSKADGFVDISSLLKDIYRSIESTQTKSGEEAEVIEQVPSSSENTQSLVRIIIPVAPINCNRSLIKRLLRKSLRINDFPVVEYELSRVVDSSAAEETHPSEQQFQFRSKGLLEIAGIEKTILMDTILVVSPKGRFKIIGKKRLKMTDFNIRPPRFFFGLFRVNNVLNVSFSLTGKDVKGQRK